MATGTLADSDHDDDVSGFDDKCCDGAEELSQAFKALSHPIRLKILKHLAARDRRCCGEICSGLPLAQSTVSQHLKVLRDAGIIELEAAGQQSHYRLNDKRIEWLDRTGSRFFKDLTAGRILPDQN